MAVNPFKQLNIYDRDVSNLNVIIEYTFAVLLMEKYTVSSSFAMFSQLCNVYSALQCLVSFAMFSQRCNV